MGSLSKQWARQVGRHPISIPRPLGTLLTPTLRPQRTPTSWGEGKGDNLVSLAAKVFHRNLRNYQYVGFETLWRDPTPEEQIALKDLLIDEFVAVQAGDYLPLGYLYQGTEAYTIVEQTDGSLTLTQYALTPVEEWKQLDNPADVPLYREVSSENQMVPASVAKSLYA